jgi:AhpD family alkylhydroperoxidase
MHPRIDFYKAAPEAIQALRGMEQYLSQSSGLEPSLRELVKTRGSQINGCAYCIDMHTKDARAMGETEQRLYALHAWRETPFYTDRERAALEWTEAVTSIADGHVPDDLFFRVREEFTEAELVNLTLAIAAINAWNRFAIAFRSPPGSYQPSHQPSGLRSASIVGTSSETVG